LPLCQFIVSHLNHDVFLTPRCFNMIYSIETIYTYQLRVLLFDSFGC
jgi:hypothetical protein